MLVRGTELPRHDAGAQAPPLTGMDTGQGPASASASADRDAVVADLNNAAEQIWLACHTDWPDLAIEVRPEVGSTNTELMNRADDPAPAPMLLTAAHQVAGRGRQGRQWVARPGDSLAFSLALPLAFDRVPGGAGALSLAVGLAVAQGLDALRAGWAAQAGAPAPAALGIKWPNDLWLNGRKLGGILIEARQGAHLPPGHRWVVVGIGLNVRAGVFAPAACVADGLPASHAPAVGATWAAIVPMLLDTVRTFAQQGFAPLQAAYARRDVLAGQSVALWTRPGAQPTQDAPQETGLAAGVDVHGSLLVHTDSGLRTWSSGEVSVRPCVP